MVVQDAQCEGWTRYTPVSMRRIVELSSETFELDTLTISVWPQGYPGAITYAWVKSAALPFAPRNSCAYRQPATRQILLERTLRTQERTASLFAMRVRHVLHAYSAFAGLFRLGILRRKCGT